jgi:cellulose 1,4-beta-cellobiosidase
MNSMAKTPSAYWIDVKNKIYLPTNQHIQNKTSYVEGIMEDIINSNNKYSIVNFIIYNLPNRDCKAFASNGEICCERSLECQLNGNYYCNTECQKKAINCNEGIEEYKKTYIDPIVNLLSKSKYNNIKKILILEPDSLPNCVTNLGINGCTEITCNAYKEGIQYAINNLDKIPNTYLYLDIGHGGWLGWENNIVKFIEMIQNFPINKIRGFATNTANYQILGKPCPFHNSTRYYDMVNYCKEINKTDPCCFDPCDFLNQYNAANNEINYIQIINFYSKNLKFKTNDGHPRFVIDTGRNGNIKARTNIDACRVWCNVNNAKIGHLPTTNTALSMIDAYAWLKTPGESDGCINFEKQQKCKSPGKCIRYDEQCGIYPQNIGYSNNQPCPPEAGQWFDFQIIQLNQ